MRTTLDCFPCFMHNALSAARYATADTIIHEKVLREIAEYLATVDLAKSPPEIASRIHRSIRELSGNVDPYREAKEQFNDLVLSMVPELQKKIDVSSDPFELAVRLAVSGNVIDFGVDGTMSEEKLLREIARTLEVPLAGDINSFREEIEAAESILYLADNAGEIVFDRMLIERLPTERVIVAVRGLPVLNDATLADAVATGLDRVVSVMSNGSDIPGTVLSECSEVFRQCFREADLIISKGQGNFETLYGCDANIAYLFKAKCPVVAAVAGVPLGTNVLLGVGDRTPAAHQ